jgi:DNA modification methylase
MILSESERYKIIHADCIPTMHSMPDECVDLAVFSPPFPSLYAYTSLAADIGNSEELDGEAKLHFSFFMRAIRRVVKPGRVVVLHCTEIPNMKRSGGVGMYPFPDLLRRLARRAGFVYWYTWQVRKNPQSQAIRTRSRQLQFAGLESDRTNSRGAMADYLVILKTPGDNPVPVAATDQVSRNKWIEWAECCWSDISETDTLNVKEGRGEQDVKHICPLQLGVIERIVRLYSDPGEVVFSPFTGIGSEGYTALRLGRRFYGCELKDEYYAAALKNCERALGEFADESAGLFDAMEATS